MSELADGLARQVLLPLMEGGDIHPLPPIGARRAAEQLGESLHPTLAERFEAAALRRMRPLWPVDRTSLPEPSDWTLLAAFNDLLQATNPSLRGSWGRDRAAELMEMCGRTISRAGAPTSVGAALRRHALFGRCLQAQRRDVAVEWWTGRRSFIGQRPPSRLLAWPNLRRVRLQTVSVSLARMAPEDASWSGGFVAAVNRFLHASPLTDLAEIGRSLPAFEWSGATLGLLGTAAGRTLALRAVALNGPGVGAAQARTAAAALPELSPQARALVADFAAELDELESLTGADAELRIAAVRS